MHVCVICINYGILPLVSHLFAICLCLHALNFTNKVKGNSPQPTI